MSRKALFACVAAGWVIRILLLSQTGSLGIRINDERDYTQLAESLVQGRGFAWQTGELTSLRPPLYPALVAGIWRVTGTGNLQAVRMAQVILSLLTSLVVYDLGRRLFGTKVGSLAASVTWLYPALIFLDVTLLTETLFTLLLVTFIWLAVMLVQRPRALTAVMCGLALGLGTLTRSVLYPVPLLLAPLLAFMLRGSLARRLALPALVVIGYAVVVVPWAVRNTRLQGVTTIVDTMGGLNLRMGNYEYTPEDRMWDAVSLKGEKSWVYALTQETQNLPPGAVFTEGMKDKWAQRKAIEYMRTHPGTTVRRALIKFGDFWGLERSFAAGVLQGLYDPPTWFAVLAVASMLASCIALATLGFAGFWLVRADWREHALLLLPVLVLTGVHSIVFGHERYHLPLVPMLAISAAALWQAGPREAFRRSRLAAVGASLSIVLLVAIWARQVLILDSDKVRALLDRLG